MARQFAKGVMGVCSVRSLLATSCPHLCEHSAKPPSPAGSLHLLLRAGWWRPCTPGLISLGSSFESLLKRPKGVGSTVIASLKSLHDLAANPELFFQRISSKATHVRVFVVRKNMTPAWGWPCGIRLVPRVLVGNYLRQVPASQQG